MVPGGQGEADLGGEGRKRLFLNSVCMPRLPLSVFTSEVITVIGGEDQESRGLAGGLRQSSRPAWEPRKTLFFSNKTTSPGSCEIAALISVFQISTLSPEASGEARLIRRVAAELSPELCPVCYVSAIFKGGTLRPPHSSVTAEALRLAHPLG